METQGFYKNEDSSLLYALNFISAPDYELNAELKDNYTYPDHGWYWFDSEEDAKAFLGIVTPIVVDPLWLYSESKMRIVIPVAIVQEFPSTLLYDLVVNRKLKTEEKGNIFYIYCSNIESEHQALINSSQGMITVEMKTTIRNEQYY